VRRGRGEIEELVRKRGHEIVDDRLHRHERRRPPLLVHDRDMPVGTAMHLVEGIDEGIIQLQTLGVRLHDVPQQHLVDVEGRGRHVGKDVPLGEHADQLAVLDHQHTA